ncbi:heterokaryon incompatibility protein-domain-containing protein, partial [Phaeosphaeria sp. MPI-PUGE-AT-0046c]
MGFIEYAALSYCWGADTQLQTTLANIAAHKLGIAILDLPQTIKDAIEIAKFVNLRYLWIDSLCIIQDSPDDWTSNCANMQQYYSNSTLTIVAGSATRCNQGFLRPKSTWHSNGFYLPIRMPKGGLGAVKLKERIRTGEPIDTRAWTLQEQLLPKRTLHFATHTVHWKCGRTQHGLRAGIDMIIKSNKSGFEHRSLWQNLVTEYMLREMSNSDDCLPAISGLASWLARDHKITCGSKRCHQKHLEYAAGLWIRENILIDDFRPEIFDIVTQLLWYSQGRSGCRPLRYRAPSWSWAAFEGPISFPLLEVDEVSDRLEVSRTRACVTACETHFASADAPYGRVTGGYISLK